MASVSEILAKWPNGVALALDVGVPYQTAASWRRRGRVPEPHWQALVDAAGKCGFEGVSMRTLRAASTARKPRRLPPAVHTPPV